MEIDQDLIDLVNDTFGSEYEQNAKARSWDRADEYVRFVGLNVRIVLKNGYIMQGILEGFTSSEMGTFTGLQLNNGMVDVGVIVAIEEA